ncbi:MAG: hypothetical protein H6538_03825 [Bacteroidales bacterium]|nr:hypothetical protein [Bacteroidales bacterium]MCB8998680.1 hypothetical protein [Bacteroidales bacterium]
MVKDKKGGKKYDFASTDLLVYIWEKRIPLGIVTLSAAIISVIVSFTITPLFRSTVIMFPTTNASVSKNLLSDSYSGRTSIYEIGEEDQAEQLLQILNSEEIKNLIVAKYNLMEHYGIKPTEAYPKTKLNDAYRSNVRFRRTEYMSVLVEVYDKDPQMAADIANDISAFTDTVFSQMLKQRAVDALKLVEEDYNQALANYTAMRDSMDVIRSMGINNYNGQAERYHEAWGKALISNNYDALKVLNKKMDLLSEYGGTYEAFANQLIYSTGVLSRLQQRLMEARIEAENTLPHKFVVDTAFKAEKKIYPKKSIIVIVSTLSAFLFGLILLIFMDNLKKKLK